MQGGLLKRSEGFLSSYTALMPVQTLLDPKAIDLLFDDSTFACLEELLQAEWTAGALSRKVGLSIGSTVYRLQQLEAHQIIQVTREVKRAGRPIKHYRATSEAYYVPFEATSHATVEDLWWKVLSPLYHHALTTLLRQARDQHIPLEEGGILIQKDPLGGTEIKILPQAIPSTQDIPDGPVRLLGWDTLSLSHTQAKAFKQELQALVKKYQQHSGEHEYAFFCGLMNPK